MFTRPAGDDGFVNLRPSTLDDHAWFVPFIEVFTAAKLPWAETGAVHSYATFPEMSEYGGLAREFAELGAASRPLTGLTPHCGRAKGAEPRGSAPSVSPPDDLG